MTANDIEMIIFKKEIEETPLNKLLDEYEQYVKLRSTDLFEGRIALIRQEIKERCEKPAEPTEAEPEPSGVEPDSHWETTFGIESAVDTE